MVFRQKSAVWIENPEKTFNVREWYTCVNELTEEHNVFALGRQNMLSIMILFCTFHNPEWFSDIRNLQNSILSRFYYDALGVVEDSMLF